MSNLIVKNPQASKSPFIKGVPSKKKLLCWSDYVGTTTGFGIVAKHILKALHQSGQWDIDQLAINYFDGFPDRDKVPYQVLPARLGDPNDVYGSQMFASALLSKPYDAAFIINDTFVAEMAGKHIPQIRAERAHRGLPPFSLVYYYPVDCCVLPSMSSMITNADVPVAYTNFAKEMTQKAGFQVDKVIYHGTDIETFHSISPSERRMVRRKFWDIDDDTFMLVNVNRNTARKDFAKTIEAFAEFKKWVPNSKLYIHCKLEDSANGRNIDLKVPIIELGLQGGQDILFPQRLNPAQGFDEVTLNRLYAGADAYISTHLGEGWGLTVCEAMAAGVPVIVPNNTSMPELTEGQGYIYPCREKAYVDNSGYRPMGRTEDIVGQMMRAYEDWKNNTDTRKHYIEHGRSFTQKYSWKNIGTEWVKLFGSLVPKLINATEGEKI